MPRLHYKKISKTKGKGINCKSKCFLHSKVNQTSSMRPASYKDRVTIRILERKWNSQADVEDGRQKLKGYQLSASRKEVCPTEVLVRNSCSMSTVTLIRRFDVITSPTICIWFLTSRIGLFQRDFSREINNLLWSESYSCEGRPCFLDTQLLLLLLSLGFRLHMRRCLLSSELSIHLLNSWAL
jgi:hypothetical protein